MTEMVFLPQTRGIYRLKIPFENLYTSVFLIEAEGKKILVDCAAKASDVDVHILPALKEAGCEPNDIDMLVLTHRHSDHAGGLARICEIMPAVEVITDLRVLADGIATYPLAGHTADCIGVFDARTGTLISGDGLQGAGVDKYRCSLVDKAAYRKTIETLTEDKRIENVLFSHAYEPWYTDAVFGRKAVLDCLLKCTEYIRNSAV